ncbi:MAG TPA: GAF and ANTAR domain-containing protein [Acidimicrobiales bacterium]
MNLSRFLVTQVTLGDTLRHVAEIAISAIPGADIAGISMLGQDGKPTTGVYTDEASPLIDAGQYLRGQGPCLDAWSQQRPILVADVRLAGDAYPDFAEHAVAYGIHSTLSLPLAAGSEGLGALNLYSRRSQGFSEADLGIGMEIAATASIVLANATAYWAAFELSEQLSEAMRSRALIEQAKGVIMASVGCSADVAFDMLRQQSQSENRKLREIAEELVRRQDRMAAD